MDNQNKNTKNLDSYEINGESLKRKADKIVAALYMVTDCIEDSEPIKEKLRSLGLDVVSTSNALVFAPSYDRNFVFTDFEMVMHEVTSLVSISASVGIISEMNASILVREIHLIRTNMRTWVDTGLYQTDARSRSVTLSESMFTEHVENNTERDTRDTPKSIPTSFDFSRIKTQKEELSNGKHGYVSQKDKHHAHAVFDTTKQTRTPATIQKDTDSKKFDLALKLTRRNTILKLIKDKHEVTIKDITSIISDCSEKTIQRELLSLVESGVLKRTGEKRWSKYALA